MSDLSDFKLGYILRSCKEDMSSYGGFKWPKAGPVEAPNWEPGVAKCGNGLHGLLWGKGTKQYCPKTENWIVAAVNEADCVWVDEEKVVFPRAWVEFCGPWYDALFFLLKKAEEAGHKFDSQSSGYWSQSASRGYWSQSASSGYWSQSASSGYGSQSASHGDWSQSASSGYWSQSASRGDWSVAFAMGNNCKAKSSENGTVILTWREGRRTRIVVGYVGENGIKPDTWYRLNDKHQLVEAKA
jgi:hypothetical protein